MSTHNNFICLAVVGFIFAALPVWAKPTHETLPKKSLPKASPEETMTIENTGSTNTTGYQIIVSSGSSASYREVSEPGAAPNRLAKPRVEAMPKALTVKLFTDLAAAGPLASLPVRHGMRSVSFGTSTFITYNGQRSPDLTFPVSPQAKALHDDMIAIIQAMHAANSPRFPLPISHPALP